MICHETYTAYNIFQDRVMLGTDYPFPLGEVLIADAYPGKVIKESEFSPHIKVRLRHTISRLSDTILQKKLLWDNAMEFLNLDGSKF